jgi:prepilin-type N-terminal cleavage/methylation domain-containing protein
MGKILKHNRGGFTLVELLVVVVIIGMLVGLLVPAVIGARGSARQAQCMNNQKELAQAAIQYETTKGHFPGYLNPCPNGPDNTWVTVLLPHFGRGDLWKEGGRNGRPPHVRLDQLVCPDDDSQDHFNAPLSYVANCGLWDGYDPEVLRNAGSGLRFGNGTIPPDVRCNGVFFNRAVDPSATSPTGPRVELSASDITDGAAQTLMISETLHVDDQVNPPQWNGWWDYRDARLMGKDWDLKPWGLRAEGRLGFTWIVADDADQLRAMKITSADPETPLPNGIPRPGNVASHHSGGVVATFCDGHGKFIRDDINYLVYQHLMTPDSQEARQRIVDARSDPNDPNLGGTLDENSY